MDREIVLIRAPSVLGLRPGGLRFEELSFVLDALFASGRAAGMSVSIFNPLLDPLRQTAPKLAQTIAGAFAAVPES